MTSKIFKKDIFSWCLYDWANSAFVLVVVTGFFPVMFKAYYSDGGVESTFWLGVGNSIAGVIIAVLSLLFGAAGGGRKRSLLAFMVVGVLTTAALALVGMGDWVSAVTLFVIANVGFSCANLFYDSLLPDVADESDMDLVSSAGFSFGYVGGALLFIFCVLMMTNPKVFGFTGAHESVKASFLCVAVWWAAFSVPLFLFVKEKRRAQLPRTNPFATIKKTFAAIVKNRALLLFLCAYWCYFDGVNTFIRMAVDFGLSLGFGQSALMTALIVTQAVAFPSSLLFGYLSGRVGAGRMISAGVVIYISISVFGAIFMRTEIHFIVLAAATGLAQGGIQALSRSYFGKLIPEGESAEYFSFYNIVSRFAVAGPAVIGVVAVAVRKAGAEETVASRVGISSVILFFVVGLVLLRLSERVRKKT